MKLSDLSIERPVFASMMSLALVLFGVLGYQRLTVRELPDIDPPIISVQTTLRGANPRVMESSVTDVLVEVTKGIDTGDQVIVGGLERLSDGVAVRATIVERRPQEAREG